jgi:hypothetical protein
MSKIKELKEAYEKALRDKFERGEYKVSESESSSSLSTNIIIDDNEYGIYHYNDKCMIVLHWVEASDKLFKNSVLKDKALSEKYSEIDRLKEEIKQLEETK